MTEELKMPQLRIPDLRTALNCIDTLINNTYFSIEEPMFKEDVKHSFMMIRGAINADLAPAVDEPFTLKWDATAGTIPTSTEAKRTEEVEGALNYLENVFEGEVDYPFDNDCRVAVHILRQYLTTPDHTELLREAVRFADDITSAIGPYTDLDGHPIVARAYKLATKINTATGKTK